jgi:hypothetical protein
LPLCSSYLPLGVPNWVASTANQVFFRRCCRGLKKKKLPRQPRAIKHFSGAVARDRGGRSVLTENSVFVFRSFLSSVSIIFKTEFILQILITENSGTRHFGLYFGHDRIVQREAGTSKKTGLEDTDPNFPWLSTNEFYYAEQDSRCRS